MKKVLLICSIACAFLFPLSCTNDSIKEDTNKDMEEEIADSNNTEEAVEDVYFVKYASNGLSGRYDVYYKNESSKTIHLESIVGSDFERIVGPVQVGFKAEFSITYSSSTNKAAVRIEVKKNDEPFVVKKEDTYGSVSYTL